MDVAKLMLILLKSSPVPKKHTWCRLEVLILLFMWIWTFVLGDESDLQIVSSADSLRPSSSTENMNLEQDKGSQDHDTNEPLSYSMLRPTPAQNKLKHGNWPENLKHTKQV